MKCYIDPRCKINYATYYIKGLYDVLGRKNIKFNLKKFKNFPSQMLTQRRGMYLLLTGLAQDAKKVYIDYHDSDDIIEEVYNYVDVYAKVNVKEAELARAKLLPVGPGFGIDIWTTSEVFFFMITNFFSVFRHLEIPKKQFLLDYLYTKIRRKTIEDYIHPVYKKDQNYIFNISTLWFPSYIKNTNENRLNFYDLVQNKFKFKFEGGFYFIPTEDKNYIEYSKKFKNFLNVKRVNMAKYIINTKKSAFVFNTPAVQDCHGWKLGEYFALGKAIISTPLSNVLPGNGKHIIKTVDSRFELEKCILYLYNNQEEIQRMEKESKNYFNSYLSPSSVINRILTSIKASL